MPSAVSTSVIVRPAPSETVCAPLDTSRFAMPIRATPCVTETSLKSGFALGKLAPTRTTWTRPLIEIVAAPVTASARRACFRGVIFAAGGRGRADSRGGADVELVPEEAVVDGPWAAVDVETCWTNGSLAVKWLNEKSCDFASFGRVSEFGSFELAGE